MTAPEDHFPPEDVQPRTTGRIYARGEDGGFEVFNGNSSFGKKISLGFISWDDPRADEILADIDKSNAGDTAARCRLEGTYGPAERRT